MTAMANIFDHLFQCAGYQTWRGKLLKLVHQPLIEQGFAAVDLAPKGAEGRHDAGGIFLASVGEHCRI